VAIDRAHLGASCLRCVGLADADILASIHAAAFPPDEAWSRNVFDLQLALPNVIGLLHGEIGMLLARVAGDEAEILTLAVTPAARRLGVASQLLEAAIVRLAASGAAVAFLEVSVKNTVALRLYLGQGFAQVGRRLAYYSDRSDARVLRIDLAPWHQKAPEGSITFRDGSVTD
jgi:[ribosomal protein S18]-alanine N-acetyltransferase